MNWKKVLMPSKWKILFLVFYALIFVFFQPPMASDSPLSFGFPFIYTVNGCNFPNPDGTQNCVNKFFPELLLLDILIPVAIYVAIGLWEARKKQ
ncbi:MAG: hypothetical protein Q7S21_05925 [archaeon]|nr:hypothetical protein [archaeon]